MSALIEFAAPRSSSSYHGLNVLQAVNAAIGELGHSVRVTAFDLDSGERGGRWRGTAFQVIAIDSHHDGCCHLQLRAITQANLAFIADRLRQLLPLVEIHKPRHRQLSTYDVAACAS